MVGSNFEKIRLGRSWVAVEQTLKFLPLARVRNDIVYEPEAIF